MAMSGDLRTSADTRSIGELVSDVSRNMGLLIRQEVDLAKVEMSAKASRAARDSAKLIAGGLVAYVGLIALVAGIILLLTQVVGLDAWLSALIVGVLIVLGGGLLVQRGLRDLKQVDLKPRRTAMTLRDDVQWAKEQVR